MSKVSFAPEDFYQPQSLGFVEIVGSPRLGEVVDIVARYHQWQPSKSTGEQQPPLTGVFLSILPVDEHGNALSVDAVDQELVAQWGDWQKPLPAIRPGRMETRESDPQDTAVGGTLVLGAEGNSLYADDNTLLSGIAPWGVLLKSLENCGFSVEVLRAGYLPDFVGLRARFDLKPREYIDRRTSQKKAATDFVCVEIARLPYATRFTETPKAPSAPPLPTPIKGRGRTTSADREKPTVSPADVGTVPASALNGPPVMPGADAIVEAAALDALSRVATTCAGQRLNVKQLFVYALQFAMQRDNASALYDPLVALLNGKGAQTWLTAHAPDFHAAPVPNGGFLMVG
ncbi:MAG TPA: hypothetical protein VEL77_15055 [Rugosimonospora sp.]|nr:hypothetical protein [Rugosimonospora sp.]